MELEAAWCESGSDGTGPAGGLCLLTDGARRRPRCLGEVSRRLRVAPPQEVGLDSTCSICFDPVCSRAWRELACGHCFHEGCILRWVQSAAHPHCPLCRFDLEASALHEFEVDFANFQLELEAVRSQPADRFCDLLMVLVGAEHCRRRLFDAVLAHLLKLLGQAHGYEDLALLERTRDVFNELLHQLRSVREVLEQQRGGEVEAEGSGAEAGSWHSCSFDALDAELLDLLGGQLLRIHTLVKRLSCGREEEAEEQVLSLRSASSKCEEVACTELREHVEHVRRICRLYGRAGAHGGDGGGEVEAGAAVARAC
mmetsp:Transcript_35811/g.76369  ORF Transcript_35811/g.76369 Transcript_35811/m.76369 type:complete len:312 (-) Transcript_35811:63-998(-)